MTFELTPLSGLYIIGLNPFRDQRGWFARYYCKNEFEEGGLTAEWVQMNHSFTQTKGSLRGMHYQHPPYGEIKMVRCIAGAIFDVVVDIRKDSPTFLQWFGTELSAENQAMLYIPKGFAHGFQTLKDNTELLYHHSDYYTPAAEAGIYYKDPMLGISWPIPIADISKRDETLPPLTKEFKGI
jgi:dTDP-4-dehydrorhamnose 3,5-epimerase